MKEECVDRPKHWIQRANNHEFLIGDIVLRINGLTEDTYSYKPGDIFRVDDVCAQTKDVVFNDTRHCQSNIILLRPVDWTPKAGDKVVFIENYADEAKIGYVATVSRVERVEDDVIHTACGFSCYSKRLAPYTLALPRIGLLRKTGFRCEDTPTTKGIVTSHSDYVFRNHHCEHGTGILGSNMTRTEELKLERWTSKYFTPGFCKEHGDRGCMCPR